MTVKETIKDGAVFVLGIIKTGVAIAAPIMVAKVICGLGDKPISEISYIDDSVSYEGTYDEAIGEITNSDMSSIYMKNAIELLKRGGDSEYYKSIIHVLNSNMSSIYKIDAIKQLNEKYE